MDVLATLKANAKWDYITTIKDDAGVRTGKIKLYIADWKYWSSGVREVANNEALYQLLEKHLMSEYDQYPDLNRITFPIPVKSAMRRDRSTGQYFYVLSNSVNEYLIQSSD